MYIPSHYLHLHVHNMYIVFYRAETFFGQILHIIILGDPFQSDSMHRSEVFFGQILRIIIFGGPFQSDSSHKSVALFGQILRINIWRPFSVRFNA